MSKMFEDLKENIKQELRALSKEEMTRESLDAIYKLSESLKAVQTIEAMEESGYSRNSYYDGNSNRGSYEGSYRGGSYDGNYNRGSNDGRSYDNSSERGNSRDSSYEGSYARRGRDGDGDGRYSENSNGNYRGYSRHTSKEQMMQKLEMMMQEASTDKERQALMRCMEQLDS